MCVCVSIRQPVWRSCIRTGPDFVFRDHTAQLVSPQLTSKLRPSHAAISANKQINNCKRPTVRSTTPWPVRSKQNEHRADVEMFIRALLRMHARSLALKHIEGTIETIAPRQIICSRKDAFLWRCCLLWVCSFRTLFTSVSRPPPQPTSRIFSPASGFPGWRALCTFSRLSLCKVKIYLPFPSLQDISEYSTTDLTLKSKRTVGRYEIVNLQSLWEAA